jgi:hypothetical protein
MVAVELVAPAAVIIWQLTQSLLPCVRHVRVYDPGGQMMSTTSCRTAVTQRMLCGQEALLYLAAGAGVAAGGGVHLAVGVHIL